MTEGPASAMPQPTAQPVPQQVTPQPLPEQWTIGPAQVNGQTMVVVVLQTLTGQHVSFLDVQMAKRVGEQLQAAAGSGLLIASGALLNQLQETPQ